jgi:hypothetical protein
MAETLCVKESCEASGPQTGHWCRVSDGLLNSVAEAFGSLNVKNVVSLTRWHREFCSLVRAGAVSGRPSTVVPKSRSSPEDPVADVPSEVDPCSHIT